MKTYLEQPAVTDAKLSLRGEVDLRKQFLAFAPNNDTWVAASPSEVHFYREGRPLAFHMVRNIAAGAVDYSADGKALHLGIGKLDVTSGAWLPQPPMNKLREWLANRGLPVPPSLRFEAARYSADGEIVVATATGRTRGRRSGARKPETGSHDWLVVLDDSRQPVRVLWHGRGRHQRIAISDKHIAAGGDGGLIVAARTGGDAIDLTGQLRNVIALAWSPDGALLAALGEDNKIVLWKAGAWDAPTATFRVVEKKADDEPHPYGSAMAFHPTRPLLLTGDNRGYLRAWQVDSAHASAPVEVFTRELGGKVGAIALSPSGDELLVVAGAPRPMIHRYQMTVEP